MDALQLLQVARHQANGDLAQNFVDNFIESLAHRKNHQHDGDIYDWRRGTCYAKPLLRKAPAKKKILRTKTLKISCWQILCVFSQKMSRPDLPQAASAGNSSSHRCLRRDELCRRRKN